MYLGVWQPFSSISSLFCCHFHWYSLCSLQGKGEWTVLNTSHCLLIGLWVFWLPLSRTSSSKPLNFLTGSTDQFLMSASELSQNVKLHLNNIPRRSPEQGTGSQSSVILRWSPLSSSTALCHLWCWAFSHLKGGKKADDKSNQYYRQFGKHRKALGKKREKLSNSTI